MAEIEINIHRYTELHRNIERARVKLAEAQPALSADASSSLALPAFKERVQELADLIGAYAARIEADSRAIYAIGMRFMDQDDALAKTYASTFSPSLGSE